MPIFLVGVVLSSSALSGPLEVSRLEEEGLVTTRYSPAGDVLASLLAALATFGVLRRGLGRVLL